MVHSKRTSRHGFTLIELLVVIAIISILATILIPSMQSARKLAKLTACTTQLKNWGVACTLYSNDADGFFPCTGRLGTAVGWWDRGAEFGGFYQNSSAFVQLMYPEYVEYQGMFYCPLDQTRSASNCWIPVAEYNGISYSFLGSYVRVDGRPDVPERCKRIDEDVTGLMADEMGWSPRMSFTYNHGERNSFAQGGAEGINMLYTDGSVLSRDVGPYWYVFLHINKYR